MSGDTLSSLRLSVKDLFAIKGYKTGAGLPVWLSSAQEETDNAQAVQLLLEQGAQLTYKTQLDELAYSLAGNNSHYGVSINPYDSNRSSGGSSSGAALSVALNEADLGLATDTGGSIRVPASYCGLFGMRPTYNAVPAQGLVPLAPRFDTAGLMTQDLSTLELGMQTLLGQKKVEPINSMAWCEALWEGVNEQLKHKALQIFEQFSGHTTRLDEPPLNAEERRFCFSVLQADSIWQHHGDWLANHLDDFAADIQQRLIWGKSLTVEDKLQAEALLQQWQDGKSTWLPDGCILLMPTVPSVAPLITSKGEQVDKERQILLGLTSIAGLSGWPQLQIPLFEIDNLPVGVSLLGKENTDLSVIYFSKQHLINR
ncbi:amidase family protein [Vibrio sp. MA40-2]|uniref:amidase family protein n=1 Tax=Vibrio sp. MA40-2 TaxID=3391828 RepID=UPI0039A40CAC